MESYEKRFFSAVNQRFKTPHWNIILIMLIEIVLGSSANPDQLAELINYGAISGFIMLNISVMWFGYKRLNQAPSYTIINSSALFKYFVFPAVGLTVIFSIFINIKDVTIMFGSIWAVVGILYYYFRGL